MKVISAELTNYCQFKHIKVNFAPGLTALLGRNGSGKSNLIKSVYAGFTGDHGRNEGLKIDNIYQFAGEKEQSKLNIVCEHNDTVLNITRGLRPVFTKLIIKTPDNKETIITKAMEANEAIINILGVSPRMLADYVFVDQWSIFNFLSMMPAERAKAFQRLFRTEHAEALWKTIGQHQEKIEIPTPGIDKDILIQRIIDNEVKIRVLEIDIDTLTKELATAGLETNQLIIDSWKRKQTLSADLQPLRQTLDRLTQDIAVLGKNFEEAQQKAEIAFNTIADNDYAYKFSKAKEILAKHAEYDQVSDSKRLLLSALKQAKEEQVLLVEPIKNIDYVGTPTDEAHKDWWKRHDRDFAELFSAEKFIDLLNSDSPSCPTCGTHRSDLEQHRGSFLSRIQQLSRTIKEDQNIIANSNRYRSDRKQYEAKKAELKRREDFITDQLSRFKQVVQPTMTKEECGRDIALYDEQNKLMTLADKEVSYYREQIKHKEEIIETINKTYKPKEQEYETLYVTEAEAIKAQGILTSLIDKRNAKLTKDTELIMLRTAVSVDEESLKQLENVEKEAILTRAWSNHCLELRHIVHRDNLPKIVAQNYLDLMQEEINDLLLRFDSPFRVSTDDTLSFIATFKDGRKVNAARLSGGEKVILALAFRVVVNDIFARDLGLLCLDEPTAGLDDANLACLKIAIERLKELSSARGLQVIIITHEKELSHLFDNIIEVGND